MPRKSSTPATPATPRKTRTRKTTASRRKSASKVTTPIVKSEAVTKESIEECINAPTRSLKPVVKQAAKSEVKKVDTPVKVRPSQPNLKVEDYLSDFKVRWQIHQFETQQLWEDLVKGYNLTAGYVKDSYNKAFN